MSFRVPKTIVLVGLMGAGKTSIGRRLAKQLELSFHDSDHEVEAAAGCAIKDIFEIYGEEAFRTGEQRVIARLLEQPPHVLATGGGSFMNEVTRHNIKEHAISIWLRADLDTILNRVSKRTDRPLLNEGNQRETLVRLISERYPIYGEADIVVETFNESASITVGRLVSALGNYLTGSHPTQYIFRSG